VLNWNGVYDTIECLESIYRIDYPNYVVIVVDNGSQDDSVLRLRNFASGEAVEKAQIEPQAGPPPRRRLVIYSQKEAELGGSNEGAVVSLEASRRLIVITNNSNLGFSEGNNVAMRYAARALRPKYFLLLNNDTIVDSAFLTRLVDVAESNPRIGILGPQIRPYYAGTRKEVSECGGRIEWMVYPGYVQNFDRSGVQTSGDSKFVCCDWTSGAALMLRDQSLAGRFLDNAYFFGCEDVEICIRLRKLGYLVAAVPTSIVYHKGGRSREKKYPGHAHDIIASARTNLSFVRRNAPLPILVGSIHIFQICAILLLLTARRVIQTPTIKNC